jgi:hypothetical protein
MGKYVIGTAFFTRWLRVGDRVAACAGQGKPGHHGASGFDGMSGPPPANGDRTSLS